MTTRSSLLKTYAKIRNLSSVRRDFTVGKIVYNQQPNQPQAPVSGLSTDVPGLSSAVLNVPNNPVGPGAAKNTNYKNPEYYCYDKMSYFEAEIEMLKYRCPQPSNKKKFQQ